MPMLPFLTSLRSMMESSALSQGQNYLAVPWQGSTTRSAGVQRARVKSPRFKVPVLM